jgi:hypothetical protein
MNYKPLNWNDILESVKYNGNIVVNDKIIGAKVVYDPLFQDNILKLECNIQEKINKITKVNFNKEHYKIKIFKYYK